MLRPLVVAYFAVPPLALTANYLFVVRDELPLSILKRSEARMAPEIPASDRCVTWEVVDGRDAAPAGGRLRAVVKATNCGPRTWPDRAAAAPPERWGANAVRFSARWSSIGGPVGAWLPWRGDLPHPVLPGRSVELPLYIPAPAAPGHYFVDVQLLQELVGWFGTEGAALLRMRVEVR